MLVTAYFSQSGLPKTGLSPTLDIIDLSDNSVVINDGAMSEVGQGFYKYDFLTYDYTKQYAMLCDSITLTADERYAIGFASNELGNTEIIKEIETGRWFLDDTTNQLILYESDNATEICRFNLFDKNGIAAYNNIFDRQKV